MNTSIQWLSEIHFILLVRACLHVIQWFTCEPRTESRKNVILPDEWKKKSTVKLIGWQSAGLRDRYRCTRLMHGRAICGIRISLTSANQKSNHSKSIKCPKTHSVGLSNKWKNWVQCMWRNETWINQYRGGNHMFIHISFNLLLFVTNSL